jgi:hypothetical protein
MRRVLVLCALVLVACVLVGFSQNIPKRKIACKTEKNANKCYWTHGRLAAGNGNPSYRLWKTGTDRILGIYSGPGAEQVDELDNEHPELPSNLNKYDLLKMRIFGDFEVCPLETEKDGYMQPACIESAKNIVPEKH